MPIGRPQYRQICGSGEIMLGDVLVGLRADATTARTITLPDATKCRGRSYQFKDEDGNCTSAATKRVTLRPVLGQLVDGEVDLKLTSKRGVCEIYSDGANWQVVTNGPP